MRPSLRTPVLSLAAALLVPLLISGCSAGLVDDDWEGDCLLGEGADAWSLPVKVVFLRDTGGKLLGEGEFDFDGRTWRGEVEGELYTEGELDFSLAAVAGGFLYTLLVDAEIESEDEIEGACSFDLLSGTVEGELNLER